MSDRHVSAELRRLVIERAANQCEYCRARAEFSADTFTIDHITPRSLGGLTTADNLAPSCYSCNQHKASRTDAYEAGAAASAPLFHPRRQNWDEHFSWNVDFTLLVGLTPTGRATIEALQLNRLGLVNLRRVLYAVGEHPSKL